MSNIFFVGLFLVSIAFGLLISVINFLGASLYDIREIKKQKQRLKHPRALRFRRRPLISIIIPAKNEATVIERCLDSILKSSYRKYEIIVVSDGSTDDTVKAVKAYASAHPKQKIHLVTNRRSLGRGGALNSGFNRRSKGELIMALDADSTLEKNALANAVFHFAVDDITALGANVRIMPQPTIVSLLQRFEYLTGFRAKKFNAVSNSEYIVGGTGAVYKRSILKKMKGFDVKMWTEDIALSLAIAHLGNKEFRLYYGSDVIVNTEPVPGYISLFRQRYRWKLGSLQALFAHRQLFFKLDRRYSKMLSWFRLPLVVWGEILLLLEPFLLSYFIYLAVSFKNPVLFALSWLLLSVLLFVVVWSDEHLSFGAKLKLTLLIPVMYSIFYIMTFMQVVAVVKSIFNSKKITGKKPLKVSWESPVRIAGRI